MSLVDKRVKRKKWDRSGVSEVVGNLLILAITVTLFSGIMFFVTNMPTPNEETYGDFSATIEFNMDDDGVTNTFMNITHVSGQALENAETHIYVLIDGAPYTLYINDSISPISNDLWTIGQTFRYDLNDLDGTTIYTDSEIEVMIANHVNNTMVWSSILNGVRGNYAPIIASRWIETVGSYLNPSEVLYNDTTIRVYARIVDVDENINVSSATVDLSDLGGSDSAQLTGPSKGGVFQLADETFDIPASISEGLKTLIFTVSDTTDKTSVAYYQIYLILDTSGGGGGGDWDGGTNGSAPSGPDYSQGQGFAIYNKSEWTLHHFEAEQQREFVLGDEIELIVVSEPLRNLNVRNEVQVISSTFKAPVVGTDGIEFTTFSYYAGYMIFNATINSTVADFLAGNGYIVRVNLQDTFGHVFSTTDYISFKNNDGSSLGVDMVTYKSIDGQLLQCTDFDTNDIIYINIQTELDGDWIRTGGDVEIRDYLWNPMLKMLPDATHTTDYDSDYIVNGVMHNATGYWLSINVERVFMTQSLTSTFWLPGNNTYSLQYNMFKTTLEQYLLTTIIHIDAPFTAIDAVIGTEEAEYSTVNGWRRFSYVDTDAPLLYFSYDTKWTEAEVVEDTTGRYSTYRSNFVNVADLNGDGVAEVIASLEQMVPYYADNGKLDYFEYNTVVTVFWDDDGVWKDEVIHSDSVTVETAKTEYYIWKAIGGTIGNIDMDDDKDIVLNMERVEIEYTVPFGDLEWSYLSNTTVDSKIVLLRNDGTWTEEEIIDIGTLNDYADPDFPIAGRFENMMLVNLDSETHSAYNELSLDLVFIREARIVVMDNTGVGYFSTPTVMATDSGLPTEYFMVPYDGYLMETNGLNEEWGNVAWGSIPDVQSQDPSSYMRINGTMNYYAVTTYPSSFTDNTSVTGSTDDLNPLSNTQINVLGGKGFIVDEWGYATDLDTSLEIHSVSMTLTYETVTYVAGSDNIWYSLDNGTTWIDSGYTVEATGLVSKEIVLDVAGVSPTQIQYMQVRLNNTNPASPYSSIRCHGLGINVVQERGYGLDYTFSIDLEETRDSGTIMVWAMAEDGMTNYAVSYSIDGLTWTDATEVFTGSAPVKVTADITNLTSDTLYIRVTTIGVTEISQNLTLYYVGFSTDVTPSLIGQSIDGLTWGDVDSNGYNDLIIAGHTITGGGSLSVKTIYVAYGDAYGNLLGNLESVYSYTTNTEVGNDIEHVGVGNFVSGGGLDIMVANPGYIRFLSQSDTGIFSMDSAFIDINEAVTGPDFSITDIVVVDFDGDGDDDILFSDYRPDDGTERSGSRFILMRHYLSGWEEIVVEDMVGEIYMIDYAPIGRP